MRTISSEQNYKVLIKSAPSQIHEKSLIYLYTPLIGAKAVSLYKLLISEIEMIKLFNNMPLQNDRLIKTLKMEVQEFNKARQLLESVELLKTFITDNNTVTYQIFAPLTFKEFNLREDFIEILKGVIGTANWSMTELLFRDSTPAKPQGEDVSTSFATVFNRIPRVIRSKNKIDNIFESFDKEIHIPNRVKSMINNSDNINPDQVKDALLHSVEDNSERKTVSPEKFFHNMNNEEQDTVFLVKGNIFNTDEKSLISKLVDECEKYDCETYISALTKSSITRNNHLILNKLTFKWQLKEKWINIIAQFVLYKNSGHFNWKYFTKVAESLSLNPKITSSFTLIQYLSSLVSSQTSEFRTERTIEVPKPTMVRQEHQQRSAIPSWEQEIPAKRNYSSLSHLFGEIDE